MLTSRSKIRVCSLDANAHVRIARLAERFLIAPLQALCSTTRNVPKPKSPGISNGKVPNSSR